MTRKHLHLMFTAVPALVAFIVLNIIIDLLTREGDEWNAPEGV